MSSYYPLSPNETSSASGSGLPSDSLVENEKQKRSSLLSPPANDVILGEEQVPRDQIQTSQLARDAQFFESSTMAERIRYVAHCLDEVQANIKARGTNQNRNVAPEEELAYAVQTIQAKLQAGALSKDDVVRARDLLQQAQLSEREMPAQRQPKRADRGQFLVAEDTVETNDNPVAKKKQPGDISLFANYDSLKTFEERLEYVYTCLKKVEENKLKQIRTDGYVSRNPGPDSEETAYNLAHEQTVTEVAKTILSTQSQQQPQKQKQPTPQIRSKL